MVGLYERTCQRCSREVTHAYSTSFSSGIKLFAKKFRSPIYSIYGFVRLADEIVDTFYDCDQELLLKNFRMNTFRAIQDKLSLNPILNSFQIAVHRNNIEDELIHSFLDSMEMDLHRKKFDRALYDRYIYGSAEVVGLMCLRVFVEGDQAVYDELCDSAKKLGAAFQKVNFLRDIQSDFKDRGRVYFPGIDYSSFTCQQKREIEEEIEKDFVEAFDGIKKLPDGTGLGVYVAYRYYTDLLNRIKNCSADKIREQRIRVPDFHKLLLLSYSAMKYQFRVI